MTTFPEFWTALQENQIWYDSLKYRFGRKDIKKCASDVFVYLLAEEKLLASGDKIALRKYVTSWLMKAPDAPVVPYVPSLAESEPVEVPENMRPLKGEARAIWLEKFKATVLETPPVKPIAKISTREIISEGQWEPAKEKPYNNGLDIKLYTLNETIKRFGRRKYKGVYSFTGFSTYKFGLVEVFADSEQNAKDILRKSERFLRLNVK